MDKNKVVVFLVIILVFVSICTGFCFGVIAVSEMIYKQNLEGYHAVATYSTNSLGEVSITKIEWKK